MLRKTNKTGFTLIELLLVTVVVCILGTIVAMTYSSVRSAERNKTRQESLNLIKGQLETYYAQSSKYPSITELNNTEWRKLNLKGLSDGDFRDPQWTRSVTQCGSDTNPKFVNEPTKFCYSYEATTTDGTACDDPKVACAQYTLTTVLEGGEKYVKSSLN